MPKLMTLQEQLIRDEGEEFRLYKDPAGKWTIGVGRNLSDGTISHDEAMLMLDNDIKKHTTDLQKALPWIANLDEVRRDVLINMTFNMGIGGLLSFKQTLAVVEAGQYAKAAEMLLESKWATQVGPRADRLARQMETGERQ